MDNIVQLKRNVTRGALWVNDVVVDMQRMTWFDPERLAAATEFFQAAVVAYNNRRDELKRYGSLLYKKPSERVYTDIMQGS